MRILAITLAALASSGVARADELHASAPRTIDFAGGVVVDAPFGPGVESLPGVALEVRWFGASPLWLAAGGSVEAGADLRDPERGHVTSLVTTGVSAGVHHAIASRVELFAGLRVDGVRAAAWPMAPAGASYGVRGGPQAAIAVMVGRAWGHPMSIEARASWLAYRLDATTTEGWQAGLHLVGVLFPDRPR